MPTQRKQRVFFSLALVVFLAGSTTYFSLLSWKSPTELRAPSCPFKKATGLYCPGCGSTRAVRQLLRGDLLGSLRYNPLTAPVLPIVAFLAFQFFRDNWRQKTPYRRSTKYVAFICAALFSILFILRNIPISTFDLLRPPSSIEKTDFDAKPSGDF